MRLYSFCNVYLSSIQQGIQTAHIQGELVSDYIINPIDSYLYNPTSELIKQKMVREWISEHKTIIVCNGGNSKSINELFEFFSDNRNPYPFTNFHEDEDSMECMCTGVGIILPEEIYDLSPQFREYSSYPAGKRKVFVNKDGEVMWDDMESYMYQLIDKIKLAPLAR